MQTVLFRNWLQSTSNDSQFLRRLHVELTQKGCRLYSHGRGKVLSHHERSCYLQADFSTFGVGLRECNSAASLPICWNKGFEDLAVEQQRKWCLPNTKVDPDAIRIAARWWRLRCEAYWESIHCNVLLVWNGRHTDDLILREAAARQGCRVLYAERGIIPGTLHVDNRGILGDTDAATRDYDDSKVFETSEKRRFLIAKQVIEKVVSESATWWKQPKSKGSRDMRKHLGIGDDQTVILFPEQVDQDVANFDFSPHFITSADAFAWINNQLSAHQNYYLLGKKHPKSHTRRRVYKSCMRMPGIWSENLTLAECLRVTDLVIGVNSTVLCEALMHGIPAIALGRTMLDNAGVFPQLTPGRDALSDVIDQVMSEGYAAKANSRLTQSISKMMQHDLYAINPELESLDMNSPEMLASRLANEARGVQRKSVDDQSLMDATTLMDAVSVEAVSRYGQLQSANSTHLGWAITWPVRKAIEWLR